MRTAVVAPDSFKGTLTARAVAAAMARGVEAGGLAADRCPLGDGGEGTAEALVDALGGDWRRAAVRGPLGDRLEAGFGLLADGRAVLDAAAASGLGLVEPECAAAEAATTHGTGELIAAALAAASAQVLVGVGGTATSDGGAGAIAAIEAAGGAPPGRLVCLCDVRTPWELAAPLFAPQKGADAAAVARLETRLERLAGGLPRDPRGVPMTGAGGGLAGGLWARFDAALVAGAAYACEATRLDGRLRGASLVITGEGRLDRTSLEGKLVGEVAARARLAAVPCHAIVGAADADLDPSSLGLAGAIEAGNPVQITAAARALAIGTGTA